VIDLPKQVKVDAVNELKERIQGAEAVVMSKWIGINAAQATELRAQLREQQVQYKVYKNTLAKIVLDELGYSEAAAYMDGPTAWAFSTDPVAAAKLLKEYNKKSPKVEMTGGILSGSVVDKDQLDALASLPSREILLGQMVGVIAAPATKLAGCFNAMQRDLVNVLDQIAKQKEEQAAA
jgi:large subunit ribosomal protein L10